MIGNRHPHRLAVAIIAALFPIAVGAQELTLPELPEAPLVLDAPATEIPQRPALIEPNPVISGARPSPGESGRPADLGQQPAPPASRTQLPKRAMRQAVPVRVLTILNAREQPVSVVVMAEGRLSVQAGPLSPAEKATLKIPLVGSCNVTVTARSGDVEDPPLLVDVCKVRLVRLTD